MHRSIKLILFPFIALLITFAPWLMPVAGAEPELPPGFQRFKDNIKAPEFSIQDTNQSKVSLSDYRGKVVLVFFWTTW